MSPAELFAQDNSQSFVEDDDEQHPPRETFEISDPCLENGVPRRYREPFLKRWLAMKVRYRRKRRVYADEEEADELLRDMHASGTDSVYIGTERSCRQWCLYAGNTALSLLLFLIVLNLLFSFATFLQLPERPAPFSEWGKPGTDSEGLSWYPTDFLRDVIPIPCHSHNDYWRRVPLFSALYNGCISVESDVWAFDDELYVGHNTASLTVNRTFQSLYINPLVEILQRQNPNTIFYNGSSHGVFDTDAEQSLTLLVDVKTNGSETWPLVLQQLEPLRQRGWLTYMEDNVVHRRPVTVVGTGETPFNMLTMNQTYRDAFFDAPLDQMWDGARPTEGEPIQPGLDNIGDSNEAFRRDNPVSRSATQYSNSLLPTTGLRGQGNSGTSSTDSYTPLNSYYASASFNEEVGTIWWGRLSKEQMDLIRGQIRGAHDRGLKARYWDLPSWPTSLRNYVWKVLVEEGVDLLNIDDLEAVRGVW